MGGVTLFQCAARAGNGANGNGRSPVWTGGADARRRGVRKNQHSALTPPGARSNLSPHFPIQPVPLKPARRPRGARRTHPRKEPG